MREADLGVHPLRAPWWHWVWGVLGTVWTARLLNAYERVTGGGA